MVESDYLYSQQMGTGSGMYTSKVDQPLYASQGGGLIGSTGTGVVPSQMYSSQMMGQPTGMWTSPVTTGSLTDTQRWQQQQQPVSSYGYDQSRSFRDEDLMGMRRDERDLYYQPQSSIRSIPIQQQQQQMPMQMQHPQQMIQPQMQPQQMHYGATPQHQLGPFHPFKGNVPQTYRVFHQPYARNTYEERVLDKMDGFEFLLKDQRNILDLYDNHFVPCKDLKVKKDILSIMIKELSLFASLEEAVLYPLLEEVMPDGRSIVERNYWEHMLNRIHLQKLLEMDPNDKMFASTVDHMIPYVREHLRKEEQEIFPNAKQFFEEQQLASLFRILEYCKKIAPITPRDNHAWLRGNILEAVDELRQSLLSKKKQGIGMGGGGGGQFGGDRSSGGMGRSDMRREQFDEDRYSGKMGGDQYGRSSGGMSSDQFRDRSREMGGMSDSSGMRSGSQFGGGSSSYDTSSGR